MYFPLKKLNRSILFEKMIPGEKYPFKISNTGRTNEGGIHPWSILNFLPKSELLLFDLFGKRGIRHFIVSEDKKIVGNVLKGLQSWKKI